MASTTMNGSQTERFDFSRIRTAIPIPNLIEVQKNSYERFLQMDRLPSERDDTGLQAVFDSVFPITDFRGLSQLEFVDYSIGDWECKCGHLRGLHHLRSTCKNCGATIRTDPYGLEEIACQVCGSYNANLVTFCTKCGDPVGLKLKYDVEECQERGMTYAAPLKVTIRLTIYEKDADSVEKIHPRARDRPTDRNGSLPGARFRRAINRAPDGCLRRSVLVVQDRSGSSKTCKSSRARSAAKA